MSEPFQRARTHQQRDLRRQDILATTRVMLTGRRVADISLNEIARQLTADGAWGDVTPTDLLAATDGHVPAGAGYPALSLISLEANGVPRNYHRVEDTVDALDTMAALQPGARTAAQTTAA